jgi:hypothetical protein
MTPVESGNVGILTHGVLYEKMHSFHTNHRNFFTKAVVTQQTKYIIRENVWHFYTRDATT